MPEASRAFDASGILDSLRKCCDFVFVLAETEKFAQFKGFTVCYGELQTDIC